MSERAKPDSDAEVARLEALGGRLGTTHGEFCGRVLECRLMGDVPLRQVAVENFRRELEDIAAQGMEWSMAWLNLAKAIDEPEERLRALSRVLQSLDWEFENLRPRTPFEWWERCVIHGETDYEIGLLHAAAGRKDAAREHLERALSLAHSTRAFLANMPEVPETGHSDRLEGKIALAMMSLE
jgi:tetratricopeptide (TPR) repeat protein